MMSVIINGGGISGAVLALILSRLTKGALDINLIENFPPENFSSSLSNARYIALSRGSYYKLISFFDAPSALFSCSTPIKQIEVISSTFPKRILLSASDYHISSLGYVIELHNIKMKIFDFLRKSSSINLFCPAKLREVKKSKFKNIVILDNGDEITGQLLIAADGSYSFLATLCGMQWEFFDYCQIAIVTNVITSCSNEGRAFEIFTASGSLAILPISDYRSSLIWCVPVSYYKEEISNWGISEFCRKIQRIFGWELGFILDMDKPRFFSLFLRKANCHISHRLALVGNAAQTLHPIAGQGFNLGFRDVLYISKIISEANLKNIDIGDYTTIKAYQISRQRDQSKIINMTHSLICLFNSSSYSYVFSRKFILTIVKYSTLVRNILIKTILSW